MKVGILTFPHAPSLGAMLQMGALYHAVQELGHDVEIINYVSDSVNHQKKIKVTPKSLAVHIISTVFLKSSKSSYKNFESKMRMFPEQPTFLKSDLNRIEERFDRIIVGSDQVWNPDVTGHDMNFYLKFCGDDRKKASYAASFGYMSVPEKEKNEIASLLNRFSYLGVREVQGQKIVKELTGREAEVVLDPTLLVSPDYLKNEMQLCNRKKPYVIFFCIKPSSTLYSRAEKYAKCYGYDLVTIGGRIKDRFDARKHPEFGVGPKEFLGLIDAAQCVFTNSFHGTAISIALHRDFYVEYSSDTNSRLTNLIDMLGLQNRVVGADELVRSKIDYSPVEEKLNEEKIKSRDYLKRILENI